MQVDTCIFSNGNQNLEYLLKEECAIDPVCTTLPYGSIHFWNALPYR